MVHGDLEDAAGTLGGDARDVMHVPPPSDTHWTTTNVGEAAPGVQTPLSMSVWQRGVGDGVDAAGRAIGVFTRRNGFDGPVMLPIYGRAAMSLEYLKMFGERMPGAAPERVIGGVVGSVPPTMSFTPTRRFHANVLTRYPPALARLAGQLRRFADDFERWWQEFVTRLAVAPADIGCVRPLFDEALARHHDAVVMQCVGIFAAVQPIHDLLVAVIDRVGAGDASVLTAPVGGAETAVIRDLWAASRDELTLNEVISRHGFHGPLEGELESRVWREDDTPVRRLVARYADRPDTESPALREQSLIADRARAEAALLGAVPTVTRPAVQVLLAIASRRLPLRGVAKRSMVQGFDAVRASARRLGEALVTSGDLDNPDDIFYLTAGELGGVWPHNAADLIVRRRDRRLDYLRFDLPSVWRGVPEPLVADAKPRRMELTGIGVSDGVVEGTARVVLDPSFVDVEPGEILVAPTTDPSWASIMFISSALVVDIGGTLSHAAVVARELGLPCVVNTRDGTRAITTGDRVCVDGNRGSVTIVSSDAG